MAYDVVLQTQADGSVKRIPITAAMYTTLLTVSEHGDRLSWHEHSKCWRWWVPGSRVVTRSMLEFGAHDRTVKSLVARGLLEYADDEQQTVRVVKPPKRVCPNTGTTKKCNDQLCCY